MSREIVQNRRKLPSKSAC